jgi:hypothetical protein
MGQSVLPPVPGLSYKREIFKASSTFTLPMTAQNKFDAVLISGGGGGGRSNTTDTNYSSLGGGGAISYVKDVYCTNGTTLTITIGAGGAGVAPPSTSYASNGTVSTISGIAGNGVSTSISSPAGRGGQQKNAYATSIGTGALGYTSNNSATKGSYSGGQGDRLANRGIGIGNMSIATGVSNLAASRTMFQFYGQNYITGTGNSLVTQRAQGNTGGPIPLLGSYLHAAVGGTGTNGNSSNGAASTANTFIAGSGGGCTNGGGATAGSGGGGGGGGRSTGANLAGTGGNGSANSGGGGGGAGRNVTLTWSGTGGTGGSGLIIIGYWG